MYDKEKKHKEYIRNKKAWNIASKKWYQKNKQKVLERQRALRREKPELFKRRRKEWYAKNQDKILQYHKDRSRKHREWFLEKLGGCCTVCGESNYRYLHLDRIKGGKHSRQPDWIKNHLDEFQILCANHHNEKTCYKEILWNGVVLRF